ncbi:hypothetical protein, partial [Chromobacterium violaceum]
GEVGRAAGVQRRGVKAVRGAGRAAGHAVLRGKGNGLQRADPAAVFVPSASGAAWSAMEDARW